MHESETFLGGSAHLSYTEIKTQNLLGFGNRCETYGCFFGDFFFFFLASENLALFFTKHAKNTTSVDMGSSCDTQTLQEITGGRRQMEPRRS